jgi:hypothetical protein
MEMEFQQSVSRACMENGMPSDMTLGIAWKWNAQRRGTRACMENGMPRDVAYGLAWKRECPETLQVGLHGKQKTRKDKDIS